MNLARIQARRLRAAYTATLTSTPARTIYIRGRDANKDPYYVLGVTKEEKMSVIKEKYFELAKKYHPDMNPDDEKAEELFLRVQEAYRMIQIERDPELKLKYQREFNQYQRGDDGAADPDMSGFKSRRPKGGPAQGEDEEGDSFKQEYTSYHGQKMNQDAVDWNTEKFLRRYRYSHLRNKTDVPMSIRNEDRHGMANLQHERVKSFDKFHVPPALVFLLVGCPVLVYLATHMNAEEESFERARQQNLLQAVRKTQKITEFGEEEASGAQELTKSTVQFKEYETKRSQERRRIENLKRFYLAGGTRTEEKVDIASLINNEQAAPASTPQ